MLPALLCLAATPALSEPWGCAFTVECDLTEGCDSVGFDAQVIAADHAGDLFLSTAMGDSPVIRLTREGALPATYAGAGRDGIAELLTIEGDRTAILSLHIFDGTAAVLTYFGTCEGLT
ncbi:hypothetical protein [Roseicyclus mahoneyensis]|jgi:hypothetical protein|uniref:Uncharacterized protein n=1 Tax=Roseicyclus mahoneyensis TaxID=164332 RepID=A0A316GNY2_9RHOB|nr:hypothetical protein [Roseicyclus mahoneyensis]PWK62489.1 hypothetical protein C7455_101516 [Roseicyclus mahoneyensis]